MEDPAELPDEFSVAELSLEGREEATNSKTDVFVLPEAHAEDSEDVFHFGELPDRVRGLILLKLAGSPLPSTLEEARLLPRRLSPARLAPLLRTSPSVALACFQTEFPIDIGSFQVLASIPPEFAESDDDLAVDLDLPDLALRARLGLPPPTPKTPKTPPPTPPPALLGVLELAKYPVRPKHPLLDADQMLLLLRVMKPTHPFSFTRPRIFVSADSPRFSPAHPDALEESDSDELTLLGTLDLLALPLPPFPSCSPAPLLLTSDEPPPSPGIDLSAPLHSLATDLYCSLLNASIGPLHALRLTVAETSPAALNVTLDRWGRELAPTRLLERVRIAARRLELIGPPAVLSAFPHPIQALKNACLRLSCLDYPAIASFLQLNKTDLTEVSLHLTTSQALPAPPSTPSAPPQTPNVNRPLLWQALQALTHLRTLTLPHEVAGSQPTANEPYPALPALTKLVVLGGLAGSEGVRPPPSTAVLSTSALLQEADQLAKVTRGRDAWWDAFLSASPASLPRLHALELRGARGPREGLAALSHLRSLSFTDHAFTSRSFAPLKLPLNALTSVRIDRFLAGSAAQLESLVSTQLRPAAGASLLSLELTVGAPEGSVLDLEGFSVLETLVVKRPPVASSTGLTSKLVLPALRNLTPSLKRLFVVSGCSTPDELAALKIRLFGDQGPPAGVKTVEIS